MCHECLGQSGIWTSFDGEVSYKINNFFGRNRVGKFKLSQELKQRIMIIVLFEICILGIYDKIKLSGCSLYNIFGVA